MSPREAPPLDFSYTCRFCGARQELTVGRPKAGLCATCALALVAPETLLAIERACSERAASDDPPKRRPRH